MIRIFSPFLTLIFAFAIFMKGQTIGMEECQEKDLSHKVFHQFSTLPEEKIKFDIVTYAAIGALENNEIGKLSVVCKEWQAMMKESKIDIFTRAICQTYSVDEETCKRFLNGKLSYRPNKDNDIGKIELCIRDLANPLKGTFDLSKCGDSRDYLSISTGYKEKNTPGKPEKIEIWFALKFLIGSELSTTAGHFQPIYGSWNDSAPIGIFWTWGGWDSLYSYEYLTSKDMDNLSKNDLYQLSRDAAASVEIPPTRSGYIQHFQVSFVELK